MPFIRKNWFILLLILVGFWLRLAFMDMQPHMDEALTYIRFVDQGFPSIVTDYTDVNNHVFNSIILYFVSITIGNDPVSLRLPSLIMGMLLIPMCYILATRLFNRTAGMVAAMLVTTGRNMIEFSLLARGYMHQTFVLMIALLLTFLIFKRNRIIYWVGFSLCLIIGFYTIPTMIYAAGVLILWFGMRVLLEKPRKQWMPYLLRLAGWVSISAIIVALLYIPLIRSTLAFEESAEDEISWTLIGEGSVTDPLSFTEFLKSAATYPAEIYGGWVIGFPIFIIGTLWAFVLVAMYRYWRQRKQTGVYIPFTIPILLWIAPLFIIMRVTPGFRTWTFLIPLIYIEAGIGAAYLIENWRFRRYNTAILLLLTLIFIPGIYNAMADRQFAFTRAQGQHEESLEIIAQIEENQTVRVLELDSIYSRCDMIPITRLLYYMQLDNVPYEHNLPADSPVPETFEQQTCYVVVCETNCEVTAAESANLIHYDELFTNIYWMD